MLFFGSSVIMLLLGMAIGAGVASLFFILFRKDKTKSKVNPIQTGLRENAASFAGMYEPVFAVCVGKNQKQEDVFAAWNTHVTGCEDEAFKLLFAKEFGDYEKWGKKGKKQKLNEKKADKIYKKKAAKLVKYFTKAGIRRETETFIVGKEGDDVMYELAGGGQIQPGVTYEVLAPYWRYGDTVLDKGAVR